KDRCDYFYPANDDLQIRSYGWTTAAIQSLNSCRVAKDFGTVTFKDITLCRYPTFNLVHRTHLDLHEGVYYPVPSHGAHQDLWIFGLYELWQCSFYLSEHQVANHVGIGLNTRYKYGNSDDVEKWIKRSRWTLFQKLQSLPHLYNQSFINSSQIDNNIRTEVPC
ncbi:unnamed protein product, partial [Adineta ricciae]